MCKLDDLARFASVVAPQYDVRLAKGFAFDFDRLFYAPLMHEEGAPAQIVPSTNFYLYYEMRRDQFVFCSCIHSEFDIFSSSAYLLLSFFR